MRQIKFRAIIAGTNNWIFGLPYAVYSDNNIDSIQCIEKNQVEYIRTDTLGQYTGLNDKNGIEIYEGDIVRYHNDDPIIVKYENQGFVVSNSRDMCKSPLKIFGFENLWVVIGNIYENPELNNF